MMTYMIVHSFSREFTEPILFQGDHSSKVQSVIRCLIRIKREDPDAKAIVFSSVSRYRRYNVT